MAITKKFKVTFDMTAKIDTETEKDVADVVLDLAKAAHSGKQLTGLERHLLIQALTHGADGFIAAMMTASIRGGVQKMFKDAGNSDLFRVSPATVRVIK